MNKEILIKFLNNQCSVEELKDVLEWVNSSALNANGRSLGFDDWNSYQEEAQFNDDLKFGSLLDKIHHKINIEQSKIRTVESSKLNISLIYRWLNSAAAILFIPVLAFLFYTISINNQKSAKYANLAVDSLEIIAPIGSRTKVTLSDGSEVALNYGSKIKYPQIFTGNTREVILIGEGFFNVAHNPEKPFIVKTGKLNIRALGTSFNVQAYPETNEIYTTLVNGKVLVEKTSAKGELISIGSMVPGQHVSYNKITGQIASSKGDTKKFTAWKDGKLVFDNESIVEVSSRLSRMFNVDIEVAEDIRNFTYTVTFVDEPLFQILDLMTYATPVTYKILPRNKLSDGTFSKQRIVISKRI